MKYSYASILALVSTVSAHTAFTTLWVDGDSQGDGLAVRMRKAPSTSTSPIKPDDKAMACGYDGESANPRVITVADGSDLTFEFRAWTNDPSRGAIDPGHKGPCSVYLKNVESAVADNSAAGDGWFKIWEEGYDEDEQMWCTSKLGGNGEAGPYNQTLSVKLPAGLKGGYYLARPELLALHAAQDGDPQFYTGCAQIFIESTGDRVPKETVSIPGHVGYGEPSTTFNLYQDPLPLPYTMPGPALAELVSGSAATITQEEGLEPEGCLLSMAGFCAFEVSDFSDEKGCWDSCTECWDQNDACWKYAETLPTSGDPWCKIWTAKCQQISDNCEAKKFDGIPDKGKVLTPTLPTMQVVMPKGQSVA